MNNKPMVYIVDDDNAVREALTLLMQAEAIPCQGYASAEAFLAQPVQSKLGCLLLDVRMPGMNGMQLLELLKKQGVVIPVIFITGHGDVGLAVQAMKYGAIDFIEKPFNSDDLLKVVRKCLRECTGLYDANRTLHEMEVCVASLTNREREVMDRLVDGKHNKTIASELGISPRTVELHRSKVMEKLHAQSLSDVVRTALLVVEKA